MKTAIEKLVWLRSMDAHLLDLSVLPNERRRFLAKVAPPFHRCRGWSGVRSAGTRSCWRSWRSRRWTSSTRWSRCSTRPCRRGRSRAKSKTDEALVERAKKGEDRQLLVDVILPVLADPSVPDEQVGGRLRGRSG